MPNFDDFERLIREAMAAKHADIAEICRRFSNIPTSNRPKLFKGMTVEGFSDWLNRARAFLASRYGASETFRTTDDNRTGGDLYVESSGKWIELKTGMVTDGNLGLSTIAWGMGDADAGNELALIMKGEEWKARREDGLIGDWNSAQRSQERTMTALLKYFESRLAINTEAPATLAHLAQCISRHITTLPEIKVTFGQGTQLWPKTDILHADRSHGWRIVSKAFLPHERIVVSEIYRASDKISAIARAQVLLRGEGSGRTARLYPNYKNSWTQANVKVPASYWVNNACFHVWIDK